MLRIGILIQNFEELQNWEFRIIDIIKKDPNMELNLLIKDIRSKNELKVIIDKSLTISGKISDYIQNKQICIETNRYLSSLKEINKENSIEFLNSISTIKVKPHVINNFDLFDNYTIKKIKTFDLDVVIKLGFNLLSENLSKVAKNGIWFLSHSNLSLKGGGFPGFWEVLLREAVVEVSLIQLDSEVHGKGKIIDKAFYNLNYRSFVITNNLVTESSVSLLFKNLRRLLDLGQIVVNEEVDLSVSSKPPNLTDINRYIFGFYWNYLSDKLKNISSSERKDQQWTLFIGKDNFIEADLSKLRPVKVPDDEFWADPFLFLYQNDHYIFFESYSYISKRGKICCGKVKDDQLVDVIDVLDLDYHLSYPFIFEEDNQIFMMPETGQNKRLELYRCLSFPDQWELYSTAFEGESIQDTTLFIDKNHQKWLFLNKVLSPGTDRTSELYIYRIDSLKFDKIQPHKQNPVLIDSRVARNGGAIFRYQNKTYRPSQSNTDGVYGKALNINQIQKLTIEKYQEKLIRKVEPDFQKDLVSMHHLHQIDGMFVFDAAYNN